MVRAGFGAAALCALAVIGCSSKPTTMRVWGDVSFEGKAIESGNIELLPIDGTEGPNVGGVVKDGAYEIPAEVGPLAEGTYRVEIRAYRNTGRVQRTPRGEMPEREAVLPAEYNIRSTLRVKINSKAGENKFSFQLPQRAAQ